MLTTNEVAQVYETILSSPGMSETIKIDLRISRKTILLLHQVIEHGLAKKGEGRELLVFTNATEETLSELRNLGGDCLQKAGLVELSEKLSQLGKQGDKN